MVLEEGVDLIQIYDGPSKSSLALIDNYSSGNSVVVHFSSKSASSVKNFQLKLQKAVACGISLGPNAGRTGCGRVVDELSCYCVVYDERIWSDQVAFCQKYGMLLLSLESRAEEVAIDNTWPIGIGFWTSGSNVADEGIWIWESTSQPLLPGYTNWAAGEPNNLNGIEHYLVKNRATWNDDRIGKNFSAICEVH